MHGLQGCSLQYMHDKELQQRLQSAVDGQVSSE